MEKMEIEPDTDSVGKTNGRAVAIIQGADKRTNFFSEEKMIVCLIVKSVEHNSEVKWMK